MGQLVVVSKNNLHKSRDNQIKTLFRAPNKEKHDFSSGKILFRSTALLLVIAFAFSIFDSAESKRNLPITFGTERSVNIFPAEIVHSDWSGVNSALSQDLTDDSIYQEFSARNSSYMARELLIIPDSNNPSAQPVIIEPESQASTTENTSDAIEVEDDLQVSPDTQTEPESPEVIEEPEPEPEVVEPEVQESVDESVSMLPYQVFTQVSGLFPLLQFSSNSTTPATTEPEVDVVEESVPEVVDAVTTLPEEQSLANEEVVTEVATSTTDVVDQATSTEESNVATDPDVSASSTIATTTDVQTNSNLPVSEITLANFDTAVLERGQIINGMQLRLSLAARLKRPVTENVPYIDVLFGTEEDKTIVGTILIDDEVSNALNGGYFLFALPEVGDIDSLKNMQVTVQLHGNQDDFDGVFLDAAWLELDTKVVTKDDLKARMVAENMPQMQKPELSTLISEQVSFDRSEKPVFNLRYNSQRNFIVRGFRSFVGRDLAVIEDIKVEHKSLGRINIQPNINVTRDGLLTIEFTDKDKQNLRPGTYAIEVTVDEGGKTYTDTFDFTWGILTTNPNKSEYQTGETAHISIGALTPNGHTICEANLNLYVIAPDDMVERVEVNESGLCDGNNVIDVPDFYAYASTTIPGAYELYLERLDDNGDLLGFTTDTFNVVDVQDISIEREGPTRIYPVAPYTMTMTVAAEQRFIGTLTERVPRVFAVSSTTADVSVDGEWQVLTWDLSIRAGQQEEISYTFDAPDISPYLFNLGPARLDSAKLAAPAVVQTGSTTASTTTVAASSTNTVNEDIFFMEHRQWQIASDAVGNMILYFDGPSIPAGWSCVSCVSGDDFFQRFVMGSSTYNVTGGTANHTPTVTTSLLANTAATMESGSGGPAINTHSHTLTPTISTQSNLPEYRQLQVIQYDGGAGEPPTIPAGAIAMFDVASSSLPAGWNRYAAQDGRYVYGENTIGTTGGSNTHSHTITGTTGGATGGTARSRGGGSQTTAAANGHTHTVNTTTGTLNNEPPYIEVVFAQASSDLTPVNGIIAMWTEEVDDGWIDLSSAQGDPFNQKFIKAAASYGSTGGAYTHTHLDVTGVLTSGPSATITGRTGTSGSSPTHTHTVNFTSFSTDSNLPPYLTAVIGKKQGTDPLYTQASSRWYVNTNNQTPADAWPSGASNLLEREPITASDEPVKSGEEIRLRMNVSVGNATSTSGSSFKLQYATTTAICSDATVWSDVGDSSSSTAKWRGYVNTTPSDGSTLSSTLLGSTTVAATYEEDGVASSTPNDINVDDYGEWDFVLEQNGAEAGTQYCFRMVEGDGSAFFSYDHYPQLVTNEAPAGPTLSTLFDNEKTASTTPWFEFTSADAEGEGVHYQIQVDNNYDFSSTVLDRDTISNAAEFENQVLISDKAPFIQGNLIRFIPSSSLTNGTTYYWRVRGQDPDGSNQWGDWSTIRSFTIDTSLVASAWFQTEDEQFNTNTLDGTQTGANEVDLITGSTTGTMISSPIDFTDGLLGTAWDSLEWNDTETVGDILYQIQYLDTDDNWSLIPDGDLAGNAAGFDTSPISLLGLDTDVYSNLRIVSNFTNSGGSPSLQDWTINWGYRVETPTITKLFANEQTGTTTPTFEFTTTDPQADSLTYQIEWSTAYDFTGSIVRTSDTEPAGFVNIDVGIDTDPFFSGDTIQYTIQPADALTGTTTYWWRVRAKDTTGDNAYSFWTDPQSFTVIPGTDVSTWFQTTEEQFDTNILSGTIALGTDAVTVATTATEAMLVYGEGTNSIPRYRQWDGTAWSSEGTMLDVDAPIKWAVVRAATTREEYVAAIAGTDNDVNAQVFSTGSWGNLQEMTISMGSVNARGFDVAYETLSGDALVVFCDGDGNPSYYTWDGSTWTSGGAIGMTLGNNCEWLKLSADPVSDEIVAMARDSVGTNAASYEVRVWNGTAWASSATQGGARGSAYETMALNHEDSGGQAISISGDGNPTRFEWNSWNGTAWAGLSTEASISDNLMWAELQRDDGTDAMALCYVDESTDIGVIRWTGAAWTGQTILDAAGKTNADRPISCQYETTAGRDGNIMAMYSDTTNMRYSFFNGATWSTEATINAITDAATVQSARTGNGTILGLFFDDTNDSLLFSSWNGSAWSTTQTLETNMSVDTTPFGEPFMVTPRNPGSAGTTIVSPGIDFTDGVGPYWDEFSWNDAQPGTSDITYFMQYQTATGTWAFIPDGDLPGNGAGFSTSPVDLSGLNINTYDVIRPYAALSCDGSGNCPEIQDWKVTWAGGITISGTANQYDEVASTTSGTVAVAVNGVLQSGKTGTIAADGTWSISNVTAFAGDIITVFVLGAADTNEAVAVTRYDGTGNVSGMSLYERHLTLGSDDATTTPMTNAEIGQYDFTNTEDIFFDLNGTTLEVCADAGCSDAELKIKSGVYYTPTGRIVTHDFENNGTFTAGSVVHEVNGSWDNNATTTMTDSTVVFAATSTTETIDSTGALLSSFNNITFGTTTGAATWSLVSTLDVNGDLIVDRGTLARGVEDITVAGDLTTGANGLWSGIGTTTFDGNTSASWQDQNATLQNIGYAVIDGSSKLVTLAGNVAAQTITIGDNDTLDVSISNYDITVYGGWNNQNNFIARSGEVFFAATTTPWFITTSGDAFYDLSFTGVGNWSFTESTLLVNNNFTASSGVVTLPTNGTTTIGGSFDATNGSFGNNNGTLYFTSNTSETITFDGGLFTNVAHNLSFNGAGDWTITDTNATSTNDVVVAQGTLYLPSGVMSIGGSLQDTGGTFDGGTGTVLFYSTAAEVLTAGDSSFNNVEFDGTGSWSFNDANATIVGDLFVSQGTVTMPSGVMSIGGSYTNTSTVIPGSGTVTFDSIDAGEQIDFGGSPLYDVIFDGDGGGWTIVANATTTNNFTIATSSDWTLAAGQLLSVGGEFSNHVGGASTTWAVGSTLSLEGGDYSVNTKNENGDVYSTIRVNNDAQIAMWNSSALTYVTNNTAALYSQDHNATDGDLYVFGTYSNVNGNEYWSYATDFDGADLTGSERQANVYFAASASATFGTTTLEILGDTAASTTIQNQGAGTYVVNVIGGTTTAQYYEFNDLGLTGVSFSGAGIVSTLLNGSYIVGVDGGSALTLSSTTIDANPAKQIYNVVFATTTAITATNVTQNDGAPTSYWWFREGSGNLYGENFDNDTGDPGSVRFDDSSLVLTLSGVVYDAAGAPITVGTCDDSTQVVRVMVNGAFSTSTSCSSVDGSYSAEGVVVVGDPTITVYLDNASGGERGSVITRTPTADITNMDIRENRVIVRNEDTEPLTIENLAVFDNSDDSDVQFIAATSSTDTLTVLANNELYVFATSTFTPGGTVTLAANANANGYDGTLYIDNGATFNAYASSTLTIGGRMVLNASSTFNAASSTVLMNATTTGKSITAPSEVTFNELVFDGIGGGWNLGADIQVLGDMTITEGTVTGTGDITIPSGSLTGNGVLSLGAGTTTLASSNTLGGSSAWTFHNLQLGDAVTGTTTPVFMSTTTVSGTLTIAAGHYLDAGSTSWDLSGTGTVFVENGSFLSDTSTVRYSGAGADVLDTQYYNLDINSGAGSQTYTATGIGLMIDNLLTVGGTAGSVFDLDTSDVTLDLNGDVLISPNGTLSASDSAGFTIAGSYDNNGTLIANGGTITFDGSGTTNIAAGSSNFASVLIDGTADVTVTEHATATTAWVITDVNSFTLSSGQVLAIENGFYNAVDGSLTTWTGSTLRFYGANNYSINPATTTDSYATLSVADTTQIRMWGSDAVTYDIAGTASLYSQDHATVDGDLYIWGDYRKTGGADYWSYTNDFDGNSLGGSPRKVDVYFASGASATYESGLLSVVGDSSASTTIQNQGTGTYSLTVGGSASLSMQYYEIRDIDSSGLVLTGSPTVTTLSNGDLEVSQNGGTAITIGGSVLDTNPAKNMNLNRFALNGVGSGFNVTATGTSVSSWRFVNHYGDIDGEGFDVDPDGDPGYIAWDDSAANITISGTVYQSDGTTPADATMCDAGWQTVIVEVAGLSQYTTNCTAGTGAYSVSGITYSPGDSIIVYLNTTHAQAGAAVTFDPVSNINNMDVYESHVIVRHEGTDPISIADMAVWDSSDDADIPFTATTGSPDSLNIPAGYKLVVWDSKTFAPNGDVTVTGGAGVNNGTIELRNSATWEGAGTEALTLGGSLLSGIGASFEASNGTTTFTSTAAGRTIDVNEDSFNNVAFTGSGSWTMTDASATFTGDVSKTAGTLTLPTGTTTVAGSFVNSGGSFDANSGLLYFTGTGSHNVTLGGSDASVVEFVGGTYAITDTNATTTGPVTITSGSVTLPGGIFTVGGDFENVAGTITHNNSEIKLTNATAATLQASSSDLYAVRFAGGGAYTVADSNLTLLDSLIIDSGSVALATTSIGGSFDASGGTFTHGSSTILFNSADGGEFINAGSSDFYTVQIGAPTGGYTIIGSATTTKNFNLLSANSFTLQSGATLHVDGVFLNTVGGANTTWTGSTLSLGGSQIYTVNTKAAGGDQYETLVIGADSDIRMWNSAATSTTVDASASLYSQDNAAVDGHLYVYGDFHVSSSTEYWSYATDFDGTSLTGSERAVSVFLASGATTTVDGGTLNIIGVAGNETTVANQGAGTYAFAVTDGAFNALYYAYRNLNIDGLNLSGTPLISSLSYGDFELAVDGGSLISLSSTTLNANASLVVTGNRFATTTAITGYNVNLTGTTPSAWTFTSHTGNLDGEDFDIDGITACGSVRWSDSSCLLTQQTGYRWRNDDGGIGAPDSEWYNATWDARKRVRLQNADVTTYTDAVVELTVAYDSDMQADFDDLRFTTDDGTTIIPHWIASTTGSVSAEVWVKVPSLAGQDTTSIYMYYNNPAATSSSSIDDTFIAGDDFDDGNISEYSGETADFTVDGTFAISGAFALDATGNETGRTESGGMYRLDQTVSTGNTINYRQYINPPSSDEVCVKFGIQSTGAPASNYAVCTDHNGTDRFVLVRDGVDNADTTPAATLDSSTISTATGWYEVEVDWGASNITATLYGPDGSEFASLSSTDSNYSSGGYGFSYWYQSGGWDNFTVRPTLATEPTVLFGAEQTDGGASWKAAQNTYAIYNVSDIARLRIAVENTGLAITNQQFLLEYAAQGTAPSCEAVDASDYASVPVQSSCGTSPVCMQNSTFVTNGASTFDLLSIADNEFSAGEARENPSNITGNINVAQNAYTELEYVITPTINVVDENLCFRVTNNGSDYDTYLSVAKMQLRFDPILGTPFLNEGLDISLLPGTTTRVYATTTVTDLNGYTDITSATTTFFRSGVGAACTPDNNSCYVSSVADNTCSFVNCSGNVCEVSCYADIFFHADSTTGSSTPYEGEEWLGFMEVEDASAGYDFDTTPGVEMNMLRAIDVAGVINYGALAVNQDTGSYNASTSIENLGNVEVDIEVQGTDLTDGAASVIPADAQKFSTTTFTYSACGATCELLSSTSPVALDVELTKPTAETPPVADDVFWGIALPASGVNSVPHQGINVFTPISP